MSDAPSNLETDDGLNEGQRLKRLQMFLDVSRQVASM